MEQEIARLQKIIDKHDNIVFFGGAGVSTESGIPDFRSKDGLYNQKYDYPPETILSHTFFMRHPEEFYRFYQDKMLCDTAKPNAAHLKLAELEKAGKLKAVITQNIDNLHQMAGSRKVLELHGSVYRNYCMKCGKFYDFSYMKQAKGVPRCSCGGRSSRMWCCMRKDWTPDSERFCPGHLQRPGADHRRNFPGGLSCGEPDRLFSGRNTW